MVTDEKCGIVNTVEMFGELHHKDVVLLQKTEKAFINL